MWVKTVITPRFEAPLARCFGLSHAVSYVRPVFLLSRCSFLNLLLGTRRSGLDLGKVSFAWCDVSLPFTMLAKHRAERAAVICAVDLRWCQ